MANHPAGGLFGTRWKTTAAIALTFAVLAAVMTLFAVLGWRFDGQVPGPYKAGPVPERGEDQLAEKRREYNAEVGKVNELIDANLAWARRYSVAASVVYWLGIAVSFTILLVAAFAGISATPPAPAAGASAPQGRSRAAIAIAVLAAFGTGLQLVNGGLDSSEKKENSKIANLSAAAAKAEKVMIDPKSVQDAVEAVNELKQAERTNY
jgi:hypothetical protein